MNVTADRQTHSSDFISVQCHALHGTDNNHVPAITDSFTSLYWQNITNTQHSIKQKHQSINIGTFNMVLPQMTTQ